MKQLNYEKVAHQAGYNEDCEAKYSLDWDRNEEKFKCSVRNVLRVYQGGRIELRTCGYRDPDLRKQLLRDFDVDLQFVSEIRDIEFFTPEGIQVKKKNIFQDILLLDHEHGMALAGYQYHWVAPGYPPKGEKDIDLRIRNKEAEETFLAKWKEVLDLSVVMYNLEKEYIKNEWSSRAGAIHWLNHPCSLSPRTRRQPMVDSGSFQLNYKREFEGLVESYCEKKVETPFLHFKVKEKKNDDHSKEKSK